MGAQLKFKTPKEFKDKIGLYFKDCRVKEKVPTKGGLALYLKVSRETLNAYQKRAVYLDALKESYTQIEEAWVQKLGGKNQVAGVIFYLKNAYRKDWKDKNETDITSGGEPLIFSWLKK